MSKHLTAPVSRLICFGSARACTNAPEGGLFIENDQGVKYNP